MKYLAVIILLAFAGCEYPDPSGTVTQTYAETTSEINCLLPPKYNLGDTVAVSESLKVGIVVRHRWTTVEIDGFPEDTWVYSIMFQNNTIEYTEEKLELVEAFDWARPAKEGIVD